MSTVAGRILRWSPMAHALYVSGTCEWDRLPLPWLCYLQCYVQKGFCRCKSWFPNHLTLSESKARLSSLVLTHQVSPLKEGQRDSPAGHVMIGLWRKLQGEDLRKTSGAENGPWARKQGLQSCNYKELNFSNKLMSLEEKPELQKGSLADTRIAAFWCSE